MQIFELLACGHMLDHGHDIAENLCGMIVVGEAVDDRYGGVFCQPHDSLMFQRTGLYDIDHARDDMRRIGQ